MTPPMHQPGTKVGVVKYIGDTIADWMGTIVGYGTINHKHSRRANMWPWDSATFKDEEIFVYLITRDAPEWGTCAVVPQAIIQPIFPPIKTDFDG